MSNELIVALMSVGLWVGILYAMITTLPGCDVDE